MKKAKYDVGDIVVCVAKNGYPVSVGKKYEVLRSFGDYIVINNDSNNDQLAYNVKYFTKDRVFTIEKLLKDL